MSMNCEYGYGLCTAPDTRCPHWQGTFCELDTELVLRYCHKCVYEGAYGGCYENPLGCKKYKRDAPDGGYYG